MEGVPWAVFSRLHSSSASDKETVNQAYKELDGPLLILFLVVEVDVGRNHALAVATAWTRRRPPRDRNLIQRNYNRNQVSKSQNL